MTKKKIKSRKIAHSRYLERQIQDILTVALWTLGMEVYRDDMCTYVYHSRHMSMCGYTNVCTCVYGCKLTIGMYICMYVYIYVDQYRGLYISVLVR